MAGHTDALKERYAKFSQGDLEGADEFVEQDDTVVVLGHNDVSKGGQSETLPVVHIWRFDGDGNITRLQILSDTLVSARLLGIA